ncbi:MAG TPA: glycine zipper 2TM domain-containing protein [Novosphingobium sp.]|nr:glycine zipper 2TM domain-containing protein [Novosphingobium sp.]
MRTSLRTAAAALAMAGAAMLAVPASAATAFGHDRAGAAVTGVSDGWANGRRDYRDYRDYRGRDGYRDQGYRQPGYHGEPVRADTRAWRGRDGRAYCRRDDGTTGLIVGGAVGGMIGHEVAGRGDRTLGAILGVAGGALLGRAIDKSDSRCR